MGVEFHGGVNPTFHVVVSGVEWVFRVPKQAVEMSEREDDLDVLPITLRFTDLGEEAEKWGVPLEYCRKFWAVVHADAPGHPYSPPNDPDRFPVFSSQQQAEELCHPGSKLRARPVVLSWPPRCEKEPVSRHCFWGAWNVLRSCWRLRGHGWFAATRWT